MHWSLSRTVRTLTALRTGKEVFIDFSVHIKYRKKSTIIADALNWFWSSILERFFLLIEHMITYLCNLHISIYIKDHWSLFYHIEGPALLCWYEDLMSDRISICFRVRFWFNFVNQTLTDCKIPVVTWPITLTSMEWVY